MSSQQFTQEIQQDIQNIRRVEQSKQENIVVGEGRVITNTEQSIAQEIPIVTEKVVTREYVPVTYEKVIQKIPVVIGQRVETGAPISQEKYVQGLNVEYVQGQQRTQVELTPQMTTFAGQQNIISQPLNMPAERISQQVFTQQQQQFVQPVVTERVVTQPVVTERIVTETTNLQAQNLQQQQQVPILQAQHLQDRAILDKNLNQNLLGQQNFQQQNLLNQQQGLLGQQNLLNQQNLQPSQTFGQQGFTGQQAGLDLKNVQRKDF